MKTFLHRSTIALVAAGLIASNVAIAGGGGAKPEAKAAGGHGAPAKAKADDGHGKPAAAGHGKPAAGHGEDTGDGAEPQRKRRFGSSGTIEREPKALTLLRAGNERFVSGKCLHPHGDGFRRQDTALRGQHPMATIVSCSDSRVPCELIFDQGIGDLFLIRVAGNVVDGDETGSIEYAVGHLNTPMLIVMGHSSCGAVTAAVNGASATEHGSIPKLLKHIEPAVDSVRKQQPNLKGDDLVNACIVENVWHTISDVVGSSDLVREKVRKGELGVLGAVYNIDTGTVEWLGRHPQEAELVKGGNSPASTGDGHGAVHAQSAGDQHDIEPQKKPAEAGHGDPGGH